MIDYISKAEVLDVYAELYDAFDDNSAILKEINKVYDKIRELKAQEPIEPVMVNGEPECGACRYELRPDADSYCPCCGRAVKWE